MLALSGFARDNAAVLLLAGAAAGWYVASWTAAEALAGGRLALRRRVLGQWIPIVTMAIVATLAQQTEVAVGVLFASSVAALSLVLGIVTVSHEVAAQSTAPGGFPVVGPPQPLDFGAVGPAGTAPQRGRRAWAFVLPAALIALLAGFSGRLTGLHALLLALQGLVILSLWMARDEPDDRSPAPPGADRVQRGRLRRGIELALAVALALLASWAGTRATRDISRDIGLVSGSFVAAMLVSPALVLPMLGSGMALARGNAYTGAISASVGIVLLNLCFGLPLVIGVWYGKPLWQEGARGLVASVAQRNPEPSTAPASDTVLSPPERSVRYPVSVWRVDTIILILLGLILLPVAAGYWLPGRLDGVLLVFIYVVYMGLTTWAARA